MPIRREDDHMLYEFFERLYEGPQVQADPLDSGACSLPVSEALRPEQKKLAEKFAQLIIRRLNLHDYQETFDDLVPILSELIVASEKAEGEDASDVEV